MGDARAIIEQTYSVSQRLEPPMTKQEFTELLLEVLERHGYAVSKASKGASS